MDEAAKPKGTVTSLSSLYPVEDAQRAAKLVHATIADNQQQLDRVRGFVADNANLVNLVHRLPDQLHHDIMVPFGKAAFFPGRLVHTNEFLVLLGEDHYVERTSKQTVDILLRRENALHSQVDSLTAIINDLKAEASFFDTTASEAAEGFVEIMEEYEEETTFERESEPGITKVADQDEEYAHILSRMDELEKEELEAESELVSEEEQTKAEIVTQRDNESDKDEQIKTDLHEFSDQKSLLWNLKFSEESVSRKPPEQTKNGTAANKESLTDQLSCSGLTVQSMAEDRSSHGHMSLGDVSSSEKTLVPPKVENVQVVPLSRSQVPLQSSKPKFDGQKAIIGSIVEHAHNLPINSRAQNTARSQSSGSQPSKPVSRFKMQRK